MAGIRVRYGVDEDRKTTIFNKAEFIFTVDTKRTFMGDGVTPGGVPIDTQHFVVGLDSDLGNLNAFSGDTAENSVNGKIFIYSVDHWVHLNGGQSASFLIGDWTDAELNSKWSNYGSSEADAQYRKDENMVHMRGTVKTSSRNAGAIFTLPEGLRPSKTLRVNTPSSLSYNSRLDITPDGEVSMSSSYSVSWCSLSLSFAIDE